MIYTMTVTTVKRSLKFYFILWCAITAFVIVLKQSRTNYYYYEPMHIPQNPRFIEPSRELELLLNSSIRYVLVWTNPDIDPIMNMGDGLDTVEERNCTISNCYVSTDREFFDNLMDFHVIVFHGPNIRRNDLPKVRSPRQKYVFASMESPDYYPVCNKMFNDFFNWTWTFKLDSDEEYGYISIRNKNKEVIGPKKVMQWMKVEEMQSINDVLKKKLSTKKHAAAWFVSRCKTNSKRELIAIQLEEELALHNLTLDIYGNCGTKECPRYKMNNCLKMLEKDYYFYLSFENSLSTDYVTEKLLHALKHYTVPVVFGGANYTRFMPDGIYLDASKLTAAELASQMAELIKDKEKYYSYFKWHNHYSYHSVEESSETDAYCKLCSMISDEERFGKTSVYPDFLQWWNTHDKCK